MIYDPQNGLPGSIGFYQAKPPTYLDVPRADERGLRWTSPTRRARWARRASASRCSVRAASAVLCALSDALGGHVFNRTPVKADMIINVLAGQPQAHGPLQVNGIGAHDVMSTRHDAALRAVPARHAREAQSISPGALAADGWLLAGGNDSLDWFKNRHKRPTAVIDLSGIDELSAAFARRRRAWRSARSPR